MSLGFVRAYRDTVAKPKGGINSSMTRGPKDLEVLKRKSANHSGAVQSELRA